MTLGIVEKVREAVLPVITQLGYEIVDVEYASKYGQKNLTIFIYQPSGISLDDCERVHLAIDPVIDELNPTNDEPYVLNVSSPGLDRKFVTQRDFERNYNKEVEVKLYAPLKGKKLYEGVLIERNDFTVTVKTKNETIKFENSKVAYVRPLVKFE